ncbi:MAG: dTDP-4-dehydrorhamnose reductase [Legionellales bacterium]|nr:dTDP-4-dehydrorhamnose reductase [Legionellales bacterium]
MLWVPGKNGQLGQELQKLLPNAIFTSSRELDITNAVAVRDFVAKHKFDTIINCAAYTAVDKAEDEKEQASLVNHYGPLNLARTGAKIIHISTDYVFDGTKGSPYDESDATGPNSHYGESKLAGEQSLLAYSEVAVVIRTSWLYSEFGSNFVKTMLRLGAERKNLNVVCDQIGSPTCASDLARAIVTIIPQLSKSNSGIYHYSNAGQCSWFEFANMIMHLACLNCSVMPLTRDNYPTKAKRPSYSVLDNSKISKTFGVTQTPWKISLQKTLENLLALNL